jgi:hypothetical protein
MEIHSLIAVECVFAMTLPEGVLGWVSNGLVLPQVRVPGHVYRGRAFVTSPPPPGVSKRERRFRVHKEALGFSPDPRALHGGCFLQNLIQLVERVGVILMVLVAARCHVHSVRER